MVTVLVCRSRTEAEIIAGKLRTNGIEAIIQADDEGGLHPGLSMVQGVRILVPEKDKSKAENIITDRGF